MDFPDKTILADIGGTHIRLGLWQDGEITHTRKWQVSDLSSLGDALQKYKHDIHESALSDIAIATAAWSKDDKTWHFAHPDRWVIDKQDLANDGWSVHMIINDFKASALGAISTDQVAALSKNNTAPFNQKKIIIGPGTGLGLAYGEGQTISETFGGHMICGAANEEQMRLVQMVKDINQKAPIFEDFISGKGLVHIHDFVMNTQTAQDKDIAPIDLILKLGEGERLRILALFHDLFGQFIQKSALYGHAFGGVYLDGGIIHALHKHKLLDLEHLSAIVSRANCAPIVKNALEAIPFYIIDDPYIALKGLIVK